MPLHSANFTWYANRPLRPARDEPCCRISMLSRYRLDDTSFIKICQDASVFWSITIHNGSTTNMAIFKKSIVLIVWTFFGPFASLCIVRLFSSLHLVDSKWMKLSKREIRRKSNIPCSKRNGHLQGKKVLAKRERAHVHLVEGERVCRILSRSSRNRAIETANSPSSFPMSLIGRPLGSWRRWPAFEKFGKQGFALPLPQPRETKRGSTITIVNLASKHTFFNRNITIFRNFRKYATFSEIQNYCTKMLQNF